MKIDFSKPLPELLRPKKLADFIGQEHLVGENKPIFNLITKANLYSFILWGPPGTGKTTLAGIIANETNADFYAINAVSSGVKELRDIIKIAESNFNYHKKSILFIDEIHRFNKAQQDALLSSVEKGIIILIGATTENPSFEVIPALRSRTRIYTLEPLNIFHLKIIFNKALKFFQEYGIELNISEENFDFLFYVSGGDARSLLIIVEILVKSKENLTFIDITKEDIENVIQSKNFAYDKDGEEHFNVISAFIKSVRGSDPDAALYWLARMLEGGEDPLFVARRLIILASEDIGNASPNGLVLAEATFRSVEKIGMPEARIVLAQCTTYLASSPKSNASYLAIEKAIDDVRNKSNFPVPLHLRNAPTQLMKSLNYSKGYKYPHNFENNFVNENYFPKEIENSQYYFPSENGTEKQLKERLKFLWQNTRKNY